MRFANSVAFLSLSSLACAAPANNEGYETGTFFVSWGIYARKFFVTDLAAKQFTKINYAFGNVNNVTGAVELGDPWADVQYPYPGDEAGEDKLLGNFGQLFKLKQENRNTKVVLSVGGWSYRNNFKPAYKTEAGRQKFCDTALELVKDLGLDGVDIDYEYPEDAEAAANFVDVVKRCRKTFDDYSKKSLKGYRLTLAISAPAGQQNYEIFPVAEIDPYVDGWNLMAFDYHGSGFSNYTGHLSNVYPSKNNKKATDGWDVKSESFLPFDTDRAIQYYKSKISCSSKIQLGMPLYGRAFAGAVDPNPKGDGMGVDFNGSMPGTWEPGVYDVKELPLKDSGSLYADWETRASWTYNRKTGDVVSFDTPQIARWKTDYLKKEGLGGAWWWEASGDRPITDSKSLVRTVIAALGGEKVFKKKQNNIYYPDSKYVNVRGESATKEKKN